MNEAEHEQHNANRLAGALRKIGELKALVATLRQGNCTHPSTVSTANERTCVVCLKRWEITCEAHGS